MHFPYIQLTSTFLLLCLRSAEQELRWIREYNFDMKQDESHRDYALLFRGNGSVSYAEIGFRLVSFCKLQNFQSGRRQGTSRQKGMFSCPLCWCKHSKKGSVALRHAPKPHLAVCADRDGATAAGSCCALGQLRQALAGERFRARTHAVGLARHLLDTTRVVCWRLDPS